MKAGADNPDAILIVRRRQMPSSPVLSLDASYSADNIPWSYAGLGDTAKRVSRTVRPRGIARSLLECGKPGRTRSSGSSAFGRGVIGLCLLADNEAPLDCRRL